MDKKWMYLADKSSEEYKNGVESFLRMAEEIHSYREVRCPCRDCDNTRTYDTKTVKKHLYRHGFTSNYKRWIFHGEELVEDAKGSVLNSRDEGISVTNGDIFSAKSVLEDLFVCDRSKAEAKGSIVDSPLFPGNEKMRALDLSARLLHLKVQNDWSDESFGAIIRFLRSALPAESVGNLPASLDEAKEFLREVGFGYELIHACKYDCALFWKENSSLDKCPICDEPRFKYEDENSGERVPQKVLYYFPLKPRLQRLFMSEETAKDMRWHKEKRVEAEDLMSHPADSPQWKSFDEEYPSFARDARNVRLGLATKGFDPFGGDPTSNSYRMWPVTLVPYNLPPSKCMSGEFFMMTLLIPGPKSPGLEIDVYLRPLIDELKGLWSEGVETHDASSGEKFRLHASLMWTISDFPTYESLSGWSLGGYHCCPSCHHETSVLKLKGGKSFGLKTRKCYLGHRRFLPPGHPWREREHYLKNWGPENRGPPQIHGGEFVLRQLESVRSHTPGKHPNNDNRELSQNFMNNWIKKSVFFELDYWHKLVIRNNIDIMYVEQSLCDNIIGTLLDIEGMTKDSKRDRLDLAHFDVRSELHFQFVGNKLLKPPACYTLPKSRRSHFCTMLKCVKLPDSYGIDLSKRVSVKKERIRGLEAHECHVVLQRLLPIASLQLLRDDITTTFSELATFFQRMCAKTLRVEDLDRLEERVGLIYCKLETIYPPSFFDIMTHSALHLPLHAKLAGPVEFRSMYPFERNMERFGKYVRKRVRPEDSIAEAYSANEAQRFCSMHLRNDAEKNSKKEDEEVKKPSFSVFSQNAQPFGQQECVKLSETDLILISSYVLRNCKELEPYIKEYNEELKKKYMDEGEEGQFEEEEEEEEDEESIDDEFPYWFEKRVNELRKNDPNNLARELQSLAIGPGCKANTYSGCVVDGIRFLTEEEDKNRINQNSGVFWAKEHKGKKEDFNGHLSSVLEVKYRFGFRVILFKCNWFGRRVPTKDCNISHISRFAPAELFGHRESYLLATQVKMGYYPNMDYNNHYLQKLEPRLFWDVTERIGGEDDERVEVAKPEDCNFEWTEKVAEIEKVQVLLCKYASAEVMNSNVLPISSDEIDDVNDKAQMFEALRDDYYNYDDRDDDPYGRESDDLDDDDDDDDDDGE